MIDDKYGHLYIAFERICCIYGVRVHNRSITRRNISNISMSCISLSEPVYGKQDRIGFSLL
jgi:hypothetical protein